MPTGRGVRFTVLVEDQRLERFVRECLYALRVGIREIRFQTAPAACGSAKQWIEQKFPDQVRAHRRHAAENVALIVGTDADEHTVRERIQRLDDTLTAAGLDPRSSDEKIAILAPRWHIETWLLHLSGRAVDEDTEYKDQVRNIDIRAAAREFIGRFREHLRDPNSGSNLPSLILAFEEMRRIHQALDQGKS